MKKSGEERGGRGLTLQRDYKPEALSPPIKLNYPKEGIQLRELLLNTELFSPVLLSSFLAFHETILNFQKFFYGNSTISPKTPSVSKLCHYSNTH